MTACGAEIMIPGHGMPIIGADRVRRALGETAEWLESLVGETLARSSPDRPGGPEGG